MPMLQRGFHILWYAALLGLCVMVVDRIFGGLTGGLKAGLGKATGLA